MGHSIKVGDKVRLTGDGWYRYDVGLTVGTVVEVTEIDEDSIVAGDAGDVGNSKGLYSEENPYTITAGDFSAELIAKYTETSHPEFVAEPPALNAVDPDHYKFPNGAEVIQISQWLTANIAQASQYLARSSRIDGKNKGDTLEDLEKAKVFIDFEIARLKGEK